MSRLARNLLIAAAVLIVLLVVADRVLVRVVDGQIAQRAQRSQNLPSRPRVDIRGFPFLTQVVAGHYSNVRFDVRGYTQSGPRVDDVSGSLSGIHLPLGSVVRRNVGSLPVDQVTAKVFMTFTDLNAYLATQKPPIAVAADGSALRINGTVSLLGQAYPVTATADIGVQPAALTFTPRSVGSANAPLAGALGQLAARLLTVTVPVQGLPFNLRLRSATVGANGVTVVADGHNVLLPANPPTITSGTTTTG